jgi:Fic family protein
MNREGNGTYKTSTAGGESVRAYVPAPLPPAPPLDLDGSRAVLLERATQALGQLDGVASLLPDKWLFLYAYVRREAVLSSQIEGTQSSLSDLLLYEIDQAPGVPLDDVAEVSNYIAALEHGVERLRSGFPLCNRLLREMHAKLMSGARGGDKDPGNFRRSQNWIGGTRPGNARFVPPPPEEVESCMGALEVFLNENQTLPVLLKAALAHVQFETIHPFLDGNGRLGRLLITLIIQHGGLLSEPLLYLSLHFKSHRPLYYELLDRVRSHGDWEAWVNFFLEGVHETAKGAVRTANALAALFQKDRELVLGTGLAGRVSLLAAFEALRARPILNLAELAKASSLSFPTASKAIEKLSILGIARELTGQRRNRLFVYSAYLDLLTNEEIPTASTTSASAKKLPKPPPAE